MRLLILDDDPSRHAHFAKKFAEHERVHCFTFDEFERELLYGERFHATLLDHDLADFGTPSVIEGCSVYGSQESQELTGTDAALLMANRLLPEKRPDQVVIHSWNIPGAARMAAILRDAGFENVVVQPFNPKE
jgi:hypothetical protein